jgi:hypothetical protein
MAINQYYTSATTSDFIGPRTNFVLIATGTDKEYVIDHIDFDKKTTGDEATITCKVKGDGTSTVMWSRGAVQSQEQDGPLFCTGNLLYTKDGAGGSLSHVSVMYRTEEQYNYVPQVYITASSSSSSSLSSYDGPNVQEWQFNSSVIIFFLALITLLFTFRNRRK